MSGIITEQVCSDVVYIPHQSRTKYLVLGILFTGLHRVYYGYVISGVVQTFIFMMLDMILAEFSLGLSLLITFPIQAAWGCLDCLVIKKRPALIKGLSVVETNKQ